jgi:hypothetical protein
MELNQATLNTETLYKTLTYHKVQSNLFSQLIQIYIYAVLTCLNNEFPSVLRMKNQIVTISSKQAYYSEILNIQGKTNIIFNNLIRGESYKLKVLIESTQGDKVTAVDQYETDIPVLPSIRNKSFCSKQ